MKFTFEDGSFAYFPRIYEVRKFLWFTYVAEQWWYGVTKYQEKVYGVTFRFDEEYFDNPSDAEHAANVAIYKFIGDHVKVHARTIEKQE